MVTLPGASYFVFTGEEGRVRRPRDVAAAAVGALLVVTALIASDRLIVWSQSVEGIVASSPAWVRVLFSVGYLLSLLYTLVIAIALVARGADRWAWRDLITIYLGTVAIVVLLSLAVNDAWPYVLPEIGLDEAVPRFPVARVAVVTAMLLVVAPYVTRPLRRTGWIAMLLTAVAAVGLGYGTPVHALGSLGVGMFSAGLLLALVGSPRGFPSPELVSAALQRLGVSTRNLRASPHQTWGLVRFDAEDSSGRCLNIKAHGRDSVDTQLVSKFWRTLTYRELGRTVSYTRLQTVEHEAFVTLMAARAGVSVPHLAAAGSVSPEVALIAFDGEGTPLAGLDGQAVTDDVLVLTWREVARMHQANISHGSLRAHSVRIRDGRPLMTDFALGTLAPGSDDLAGDIVELLFSMSLIVGPQRAAQAALEGIGADALTDTLPYLQVPAVSMANRRQAEKPKKIVAALTEAIVNLTSTEQPELVELRRVTLKSLVMVGLLLFMAAALIPQFARVDYGQIWDALASADWLLVVIAVIVGHSQFFPQATAVMFAVPAKLPFWPLLVLQSASQFIGLAVPSAAGRVAMNAAFLRRFGVSLTESVTLGAIDGFSGFLVQVAIMLVVMLTGDVELGVEIDTSRVPWLLLLAGIATIMLVALIVVLRVRVVHDRVVPVVKEAWAALTVVLKEPVRAIGLLGSGFVYWNILGITLWILVTAIGGDLGYGAALFTAAGASLLAGFMPVPGGVGVAEATLIALLATFGVDESVAIAATACYRLITFYLPALEGFFGTRWLQRAAYI